MKKSEKKNQSSFLMPAILGSVAFGILVLPFWIWSGEWNVFDSLAAMTLAGLWIGHFYQVFQAKNQISNPNKNLNYEPIE